MITERGQLAWQKATIETTMGRYKALIGPRPLARDFAAQQTEAAIGVAVLIPASLFPNAQTTTKQR
jgi:hypothetical protein